MPVLVSCHSTKKSFRSKLYDGPVVAGLAIDDVSDPAHSAAGRTPGPWWPVSRS